MRAIALKLIVILVAGIAVASCRTSPIYNVQSSTMSTSTSATLADVTRTIKQAGAGLGWQMMEKGPGHIEGKLLLRKHMALVDIQFDTKTFSIMYLDSSNLDYNGTLIHSNYNGWIQNLERAILAQTSAL